MGSEQVSKMVKDTPAFREPHAKALAVDQKGPSTHDVLGGSHV